MQAFFFVAYLCVGFAQLFAIMDWLAFSFDWGGFGSFIGALFVTYIPLLGSILGVLGAHDVWGWSWLASLLLFFWYLPVFFLIGMFSRN